VFHALRQILPNGLKRLNGLRKVHGVWWAFGLFFHLNIANRSFQQSQGGVIKRGTKAIFN
jgi:hypothetical protein